MPHALQIDTLEFSKKLRAAGADEKLADAIVEGLTAADTSNLATKADLAEMRAELSAEIAGVRAELNSEIASVRTDLGAKIAEVRADLGAKIADVRADLLKYMIGLFIAQAGLLITVLKLFPL